MSIRSPLNALRGMMNASFSKHEILSFLEELHITNPDWFLKKGAVTAAEELSKSAHYDAVYKMHTLGTPVDVQSLRSDFSRILLYLEQEQPIHGFSMRPLHFKGLSYGERKAYRFPNGEYVESLPQVHELCSLVNFFYPPSQKMWEDKDYQDVWSTRAVFFLDFGRLSKEVRRSLLERVFANKNKELSTGYGYTDLFTHALDKLLVDVEHEDRAKWLKDLMHHIKEPQQSRSLYEDYFFKSPQRIAFDALVERKYEPWVKETYESIAQKPFYEWYFQYNNFAKQRDLKNQMVSLFLSPEAFSANHGVFSSQLLRKTFEEAFNSFENKNTLSGTNVFLLKAMEVLVEDTRQVIKYACRLLDDEKKQQWLQGLTLIGVDLHARNPSIPEEDWDKIHAIKSLWDTTVLRCKIKAPLRSETPTAPSPRF